MLLLDSATLSIHEIDDAALVMPAALPPNIAFEHFETTARAHFGNVYVAAQFPAFRLGSGTLVFVRLSGGRGWAWASRIRVAHDDQFPICNASIGGDFLFLWPVPMAINAYLGFREKARRVAGIPAHLTRFVRAVEGHPPSMSFVAHARAGGAISATRELRAKDLTVAQRLFVASLAPHTTTFCARRPTDRWSEVLGDQDRRHLHDFLRAAAGDGGARVDGAAFRSGGVGAPARAVRRRRHGARAAFDLPDDVVGRVASVHLAQSMASIAEMGEAVARLRLVSQQFRRATDVALQQLVHTVTVAARSLLGDRPREPVDVQAVVHAAGLTLRRALALQDDAGWRAYARARVQVERCDGGEHATRPALSRSPRERERLLWRVGVA